MADKITEEMIGFMFDTIIQINDKNDCAIFFKDLCTINELEQMAQRIWAAKLLLEKKTYAKVIAETDISSATLSRVSTCVRHGAGGYRKFIKPDSENL